MIFKFKFHTFGGYTHVTMLVAKANNLTYEKSGILVLRSEEVEAFKNLLHRGPGDDERVILEFHPY